MSKDRIRLAREDELPKLQEIELSAGKIFAEIGMRSIADAEPPSILVFKQACAMRNLWVFTDSADSPVAFLMSEEVDGCVHIEQVSVAQSHARQSIGRQLIEHLKVQARVAGRSALTLTTFTDVEWNAPYYHRLGFRALAEHKLTAGLAQIRRAEKQAGLDHWPRVCMRLDL